MRGRLVPPAAALCLPLALLLALLLPLAGAGAQQHLHGPGGDAKIRIEKMRVADGQPLAGRPLPPRRGRNRCIAMDGIAGAQLFSDRAIELTMKTGRRFRMFFAQDCPALSFYQGFYYRRARAGQLCAGRDAVGARSGGECPIASIIEVGAVGRRASRK